MKEYYEPAVEICYKPPRSTEWKRYRFPISEMFTELAPLPSTRELSFDIEAVVVSQEMTTRRFKLSEMITEKLANKLYELFSANDTINGYDQKQWDEINPASESHSLPRAPAKYP